MNVLRRYPLLSWFLTTCNLIHKSVLRLLCILTQCHKRFIQQTCRLYLSLSLSTALERGIRMYVPR
jgi:hypothetical protein